MKVQYIILIFLVIFIVILTFSCFCSSQESYQSPSIEFLTKEESFSIIKKDDDGFFKRFFPADLYARKVTSIEEYLKKTEAKGVSNFTKEEKKKVETAVTLSKEILKTKQMSWFDGMKASEEAWRFAKTTQEYEEGLPHTRGNVIFISTKNLEDDINILSETLSHEKIHVYQKTYPLELLGYLSLNGFVKKEEIEERDLIRANPDVDNFIYELNGVEIKCEYRSPYPESILDVKNGNQYYEHPFERQVFDIL